MALIGVTARSFGNLEIVQDVFNFLLGEKGAGKILHLGNFKTDPSKYVKLLKGESEENGLLSEAVDFLEGQLEREDLEFKLMSAEDGTKLLKKAFTVIPGPDEGGDPDAEETAVEVVGGKLILLTPSLDALSQEEKETATLICTSQWAKPVLRREEDCLILCPGHLAEQGAEVPPSFATVEILQDKAVFTFYNLHFKTILEKEVPLKGAKFTVK